MCYTFHSISFEEKIIQFSGGICVKIVFLDAKSIGEDIDLSGFDALGEVVKYDFSSPEEVPARV